MRPLNYYKWMLGHYWRVFHYEIVYKYFPKALIRRFRWWNFHRKLNNIAKFIENHKLYPVNLDKELLEVWKRNESL